MNKQTVESTVAAIFKETLGELKTGKNVHMAFYLFFQDGYWKFPGTGQDKDTNYALVSYLIDRVKPQAYALVSDTFARDYHTNEIMYEQLMACVVGADGVHNTIFQPYDRLPNGKIKLSRPRKTMDGLTLTGIAVSLFEPTPDIFPNEEAKAEFSALFEARIAFEKVPYREGFEPTPPGAGL